MPPSKESVALKELFKILAAQFPQNDNPFLERAVYDQVHTAAAECPGTTYSDLTVAGRPCLWITSAQASAKHVILFMHGGGYSFGSPASHRKLAAHLARACGASALSVDYRLTPEHPYPAAIDDCVGAYSWLLEQGYSASNIAVAGDSCGGGLSCSVPLAAQRKDLPAPAASVALSPWFDATFTGESHRTNSEADVLNTLPFVNKLADRFTGGNDALRKDALVSPLLADEKLLKTLPPLWISCGGDDMLRDDGVQMAERVRKAGGEVVLEVHEGQQHVFEFMAGKAPEADESLRKIGEWVKGRFGS